MRPNATNDSVGDGSISTYGAASVDHFGSVTIRIPAITIYGGKVGLLQKFGISFSIFYFSLTLAWNIG